MSDEQRWDEGQPISQPTCANNCSRINTDGNREPTLARHGRLCTSCYDRLEKWLKEIPERYALVPTYLLKTADLEPNSKIKSTKKPTAPIPLRLSPLDLLDNRLGRKWQGTEPATDRRGAIGALLAIANEIRVSTGSTRRQNSTITHEAETIRGRLPWLANQEWVTDAYQEIRTLHRELGDAIGEYPPEPVGKCFVIPKDQDTECGGPLLPNHSGVHCPRCGTTWNHDELRHLGMALEA